MDAHNDMKKKLAEQEEAFKKLMAQSQAKLSDEIKEGMTEQIQLIQDLIVRQGTQVNQQIMQLSKNIADDKKEKENDW